MKVKQSSGCDDILCMFLKKVKDKITLPFSMFVNKSLESGIVPKSMKVAKVVPNYNQKLKINSVTIALYRYYRFCQTY